MRSPTRMTTASTSWAADAATAVPATRRIIRDFFIRQPTTGNRQPLFVFRLRQCAGVAERQAFGEDGNRHFFPCFADDLGDSVADLLLFQSFANYGSRRLHVDHAGRPPLVHLENVKARVCSYDAADGAGFQSKDLIFEHFRQLAAADEADLATFLRVGREGVLAGEILERGAFFELLLDLIGEAFVVDENLPDVHLFAAPEFRCVLIMVGAYGDVGGG